MKKVRLLLIALVLLLSSIFTGCDDHVCTFTTSRFGCTVAIEYWQHSSGLRNTVYIDSVGTVLPGNTTLEDCDGIIGNFCVSCITGC